MKDFINIILNKILNKCENTRLERIDDLFFQLETSNNSDSTKYMNILKKYFLTSIVCRIYIMDKLCNNYSDDTIENALSYFNKYKIFLHFYCLFI